MLQWDSSVLQSYLHLYALRTTLTSGHAGLMARTCCATYTRDAGRTNPWRDVTSCVDAQRPCMLSESFHCLALRTLFTLWVRASVGCEACYRPRVTLCSAVVLRNTTSLMHGLWFKVQS